MKILHLIIRRITVALGLVVAGDVSPPASAAVMRVQNTEDVAVIIGRKLLDEFEDGMRRTRVIPSIVLHVQGGVVKRGAGPGAAISPGERYYVQYLRAGQFSEVIPVQATGA